MLTYADLIEVAYKKERVHGRRMARQLAISDEDALQQVMENVAGDQPLNDLVGKRRQAANDASAKIATAKQAKAAVCCSLNQTPSA